MNRNRKRAWGIARTVAIPLMVLLIYLQLSGKLPGAEPETRELMLRPELPASKNDAHAAVLQACSAQLTPWVKSTRDIDTTGRGRSLMVIVIPEDQPDSYLIDFSFPESRDSEEIEPLKIEGKQSPQEVVDRIKNHLRRHLPPTNASNRKAAHFRAPRPPGRRGAVFIPF